MEFTRNTSKLSDIILAILVVLSFLVTVFISYRPYLIDDLIPINLAILLSANAGNISYQVGSLVVGGNFIVGGMIFLMIILALFFAITKSAKWVNDIAAESNTRTLDSQKKIEDSQTDQKTLMIVSENHFYQAINGAMKFVKTNSIASLILILVNMIGGMFIGKFILDISYLEVTQVYGFLTIGVGLIFLLPAFLASMAALISIHTKLMIRKQA